MKRIRRTYAYKPQPLKEAAREVIRAHADVARQRRALEEAIKTEESAINNLVFLLQQSQTKSVEVDLIKFKLTKRGTLEQILNIGD
jgi:hypothetical protein